jgi:hypothetical protein
VHSLQVVTAASDVICQLPNFASGITAGLDDMPQAPREIKGTPAQVRYLNTLDSLVIMTQSLVLIYRVPRQAQHAGAVRAQEEAQQRAEREAKERAHQEEAQQRAEQQQQQQQQQQQALERQQAANGANDGRAAMERALQVESEETEGAGMESQSVEEGTVMSGDGGKTPGRDADTSLNTSGSKKVPGKVLAPNNSPPSTQNLRHCVGELPLWRKPGPQRLNPRPNTESPTLDSRI